MHTLESGTHTKKSIKRNTRPGVVTLSQPQGRIGPASIHILTSSVYIDDEGNGQVHILGQFLGGERQWLNDRWSAPAEGTNQAERWFNFDVKDHKMNVNIMTNNQPIDAMLATA